MLHIFYDGVIALFVCMGIVSLLWMILAYFLAPRSGQDVFISTIIATHGNPQDAERYIHALFWLQNTSHVIVVGEPNEESRIMELKYQPLVVLTPENLPAYLKSKLPTGVSNGERAY